MARFKEGDWVYTYDEQGLVYKNQVRDNVGFLYLLTGKHEPVSSKYVFKTKKECLQAMEDAGVKKVSLHTATVIKLEKQVADLEAKLADTREECSQLFSDNVRASEEITELKQQLAEKEEEIKNIGKYYDKVTYDLRELFKQKDQDKISFAVEQLEKVRKYIVTAGKDAFGMPYLMKPDYVLEFINNQIIDLKDGNQ